MNPPHSERNERPAQVPPCRAHLWVAVVFAAVACTGLGALVVLNVLDTDHQDSAVDEFYALILAVTAVAAVLAVGSLVVRSTVRSVAAATVAPVMTELDALRRAVEALAKKTGDFGVGVTMGMELVNGAAGEPDPADGGQVLEMPPPRQRRRPERTSGS